MVWECDPLAELYSLLHPPHFHYNCLNSSAVRFPKTKLPIKNKYIVIRAYFAHSLLSMNYEPLSLETTAKLIIQDDLT